MGRVLRDREDVYLAASLATRIAAGLRIQTRGSMLELRSHVLAGGPGVLGRLSTEVLDGVLRMVMERTADQYDDLAADKPRGPLDRHDAFRVLVARAEGPHEVRELAVSLAEAGLAAVVTELVRPPGLVASADLPQAMASAFVHAALPFTRELYPGGHTEGGVGEQVTSTDVAAEWLVRFQDDPGRACRFALAWGDRFGSGGAFHALITAWTDEQLQFVFDVAIRSRIGVHAFEEFDRLVPMSESIRRHTALAQQTPFPASLAFLASIVGVGEALATYMMWPTVILDEQDLGRSLTSMARRLLLDIAEVKEALG